MLTARRALFDAGHYAPVQRAVAAAIAAVAPRVVLDAGCGEGSWLGAVTAPVRLGIDVAKPGIRLAARRHRDCRWAVASSFQLPLDDASVDAVLCVFAPIAAAEFSRVLRPDGIAVLVTPGPDHLRGLTDLIYADVLPHAPLPAGEDTPLHHERVRYTLGLDRAEDIANLARMTPYWWKATAAQQAGILGRSALDVVVDMTITVRPRAA